jgi:hypothetical protein
VKRGAYLVNQGEEKARSQHRRCEHVRRSLETAVVLDRGNPGTHFDNNTTAHEFGLINDGRHQGFDGVV